MTCTHKPVLDDNGEAFNPIDGVCICVICHCLFVRDEIMDTIKVLSRGNEDSEQQRESSFIKASESRFNEADEGVQGREFIGVF